MTDSPSYLTRTDRPQTDLTPFDGRMNRWEQGIGWPEEVEVKFQQTLYPQAA